MTDGITNPAPNGPVNVANSFVRVAESDGDTVTGMKLQKLLAARTVGISD